MKDDDLSHRRHAIQVVAALPEETEDALILLRLATQLVIRFPGRSRADAETGVGNASPAISMRPTIESNVGLSTSFTIAKVFSTRADLHVFLFFGSIIAAMMPIA